MCWIGIAGADETQETATAVHVALAPDTLRVAPGEEFTLELGIDVSGKRFNAYDAIVEFDSNVVVCLPPGDGSSDEGELMTDACGNTFHRFTVSDDSLSISHVTLCSGVALTGPGTLHWLRFRARANEGVTAVRLRRVQFYNAGIFVNPAQTQGAIIIVSRKAMPQKDVTGLYVRPATNPFKDVAEQTSGRWRGQG